MEQANQLLDFNQKLDIGLLDHVVNTVYTSTDAEEVRAAQAVLTQLGENPDAWTRVDSILEYSQNSNTKFYALQILEKLIKTRWKVLPSEQREGIKGFIVALVIKLTQEDAVRQREKVLIGKLNLILVAVLKQDWPHNWPTFISDIVAASKGNESLCLNNMVILKLLSEEIFDFSSGQMTSGKIKVLKDAMCSEFLQVFNLCIFVLDSSQNAALVEATLETLLRFLDWIPLNYIFETKLIDTLVYKFLSVPLFRNVTTACLTEVASLRIDAQYDELFVKMFGIVMEQLSVMLPRETNVALAYRNGADEEQKFIQNLSLFLTTFLKEHGKLLEQRPATHETLLHACQYLVLISRVEETEVFKICLEFWNQLAASLYVESPFTVSTFQAGGAKAAGGGGGGGSTPRRELYAPVLSMVRSVMISRMAKPEEVLVVENEQGEIIREIMKDTDAINMYKSMRETLVYLTHLDYIDTENLMTDRLRSQVDNSEWSWKNLNTLCWAIGSISGAMNEEREKQFLVTVIKDLLGMCEMKRGKDNKAVIASNIMYIVGQYPRFLRAHWKFLKTVVYKLFEFMHELHDGVQDMACDTFIKISQKCRKHFISTQLGETSPFIHEILNTMNSIICDLQPAQIHTFYEAVGYMIAAQADVVVRERLIEKCMEMPNHTWDNIIAECAKSTDVLQDQEALKTLGNILKTNISAATSMGHCYVAQLGRVYLDMLNVYNCVSECISQAIAANGEGAAKTPQIKAMRAVKKDVLKLIDTWVSRSEDNIYVSEKFVPPLLNAVLGDYHRNIPQARDAEVLAVMTTVVTKLGEHITKDIPLIFDAIFECTLNMINQDLAMFPEHRTNFFLFLQAVNQKCFPAFFAIPQNQFKLVIDSITWALKHTMRNIADTGLAILYELFQNVASSEVSQPFYQTFYIGLLEYILLVLTDTSHKSGFKMQTTILAYMLSLVEGGGVTVPLFDQSQHPADMTNVNFVKQHIANFLQSQFNHLTPTQIQSTVVGLFSFDKNLPQFKNHVRDFLVECKQFAGDDNSDLFLEEKEAAMRQAEEEKRKVQMAVPGILNPHDQPDEVVD